MGWGVKERVESRQASASSLVVPFQVEPLQVKKRIVANNKNSYELT